MPIWATARQGLNHWRVTMRTYKTQAFQVVGLIERLSNESIYCKFWQVVLNGFPKLLIEAMEEVLTGLLTASPVRKGRVKGSYTKMAIFLTGKPRPGGRGGLTFWQIA